MEDQTILAMRQKNQVLRERLSRLMSEGEGNWTSVHQPRSDGEDKENRQKYLKDLRESVEEIKNRQFELPSREKHVYKNDEVKHKEPMADVPVPRTGQVRSYAPIETSFNDDTIDNGKTKQDVSQRLARQEETIARLQQQLNRETKSKQELIEEFQKKEADQFKEYLQKLAHTKQEYQQREAKVVEQHSAKEQRLKRQLDQALADIKHHKSVASAAKISESDLKNTLRSVSHKLITYKSQIDELRSKNDALISVNRYLETCATLSPHRAGPPTHPIDEIEYNGVEAGPGYLHRPYGVNAQIYDDNDDDTDALIRATPDSNLEDSTTAQLIKGEMQFKKDVCGSSPLKKYFTLALFISRIKVLAAARRRRNQRLNSIVYSDLPNM